MEPRKQEYFHGHGVELISGDLIAHGSELELEPWGFKVIEEG